jgi:hypothetical protein
MPPPRSPGTAAGRDQQLQFLQVQGSQRQPADLQVQGLQRQPLFSIVFSMIDSPSVQQRTKAL